MEYNEKICDPLSGMPLGYSYVPIQQLGEVYCVDKGFCRGTIFPELDLPLGVYGHNFNISDQRCTASCSASAEAQPETDARWGYFDGKQ